MSKCANRQISIPAIYSYVFIGTYMHTCMYADRYTNKTSAFVVMGALIFELLLASNDMELAN